MWVWALIAAVFLVVPCIAVRLALYPRVLKDFFMNNFKGFLFKTAFRKTKFSSEVRDSGGDVLYAELWKACAGPLVEIPRIGERVYNFPQGHMEQLEASMNQEMNQRIPKFSLSSKILCKVMDIRLMAEQETDEVYAQITLIPEAETTEPTKPDPYPLEQPRPAFYSFCKVLTASDTSTHGGFSLLRKHANECLPPLDMSQPVQRSPWLRMAFQAYL